MRWLSLIASVMSLLVVVTRWLESRRLLAAGEAQLALQLLQESHNAVEQAQAARRAVRDQLQRNPECVYEPDEFQRHE